MNDSSAGQLRGAREQKDCPMKFEYPKIAENGSKLEHPLLFFEQFHEQFLSLFELKKSPSVPQGSFRLKNLSEQKLKNRRGTPAIRYIHMEYMHFQK